MCRALGHVTCSSLRDVQRTTPFYNLNLGSGMPCDTPKETQPAAGRARIPTQAEWGVLLARVHSHSSSPRIRRGRGGVHWGTAMGVPSMLIATLDVALRVPRGPVGVSVGGATGVRQSQVRKAQLRLRSLSPRQGQAVALCVSSPPGGAAASLPCILRCDSRPLLVCDVVLRRTHFCW